MVRSAEEVRATIGKVQGWASRTLNWTGDLVRLPGGPSVATHPLYYHIATPLPAVQRPIMRELELVNRYITAQYLSLLAMAGLLVIPEYIELPCQGRVP